MRSDIESLIGMLLHRKVTRPQKRVGNIQMNVMSIRQWLIKLIIMIIVHLGWVHSVMMWRRPIPMLA